MELKTLIPQIWAKRMDEELWRGIDRSPENLARLKANLIEHEKRMAQDPEYAQKWREFEKSLQQEEDEDY